MEIYTLGFTKKSAAGFFGIISTAGIRRLLDIRLNNISQLAGFTRRDDLAFFLRELCAVEYRHELQLAPTKVILDAYRRTKDWPAYQQAFSDLITERHIERLFTPEFFNVPTVFLCGEPTAEHCHRRLVAEYLCAHFKDLHITHL